MHFCECLKKSIVLMRVHVAPYPVPMVCMGSMFKGALMQRNAFERIAQSRILIEMKEKPTPEIADFPLPQLSN